MQGVGKCGESCKPFSGIRTFEKYTEWSAQRRLGACAHTGRCFHLEALGHPCLSARPVTVTATCSQRRGYSGDDRVSSWGSYFKHWRYKNDMGKCFPPSGSPSTVGMGSKHGSIHCNRGIAAGTPLSTLGSGVSITSETVDCFS